MNRVFYFVIQKDEDELYKFSILLYHSVSITYTSQFQTWYENEFWFCLGLKLEFASVLRQVAL